MIYYYAYVNQWSLLPIQCQQEFLILGSVRKKTLFSTNSSIVIQHDCENTAQLWNSSIESQLIHQATWLRGDSGARWPWDEAPLQLDSSALLRSVPLAWSNWLHSTSEKRLHCFSSIRETRSPWWKGKIKCEQLYNHHLLPPQHSTPQCYHLRNGIYCTRGKIGQWSQEENQAVWASSFLSFLLKKKQASLSSHLPPHRMLQGWT